MTLEKNRRTIILSCIVLLLWLPIKGTCEPVHLFPGKSTRSMTLTIYNEGIALVDEVREVNLPKVKNPYEIVFEGVPSTIEPTSLQVKSSSSLFRILDQNYEYDLLNTKNLLDKFIGKEVTVVIPDPQGSMRGASVVKKGKLLSNNDRPIFQFDNMIYLGSYSSIMLAGIPENLRAKPALVWLVKNEGPTKQNLEISYLANRCTWKADYVLKIDKNNTSGALFGWVTIENKTGMTFSDARLKLVAGKIHRAKREKVRFRRVPEYMAKAGAEEKLKEEAFFEYHLYTLPRLVTVRNNQTKQVSLLDAPNVKLHRVLISKNMSPNFYYSIYNGPVQKTHPQIRIEFTNLKKYGLGIPLPKGVMRGYQKSSDGSLLFVGEDNIQHTPKGEKVSLTMGEAFDITVERTQKNFERVGQHVVENTWEIKVKNAKETPDKVILEEHVPGDWKFISNPDGFKKTSSNWIKKMVSVPASGEKTVTYGVRVRF